MQHAVKTGVTGMLLTEVHFPPLQNGPQTYLFRPDVICIRQQSGRCMSGGMGQCGSCHMAV